MTVENGAPSPPGAGPSGPESGRVDGAPGTDPIFLGTEPVERPVRRATLLFQFFLVPLMIVVAAVAVFVLFGAIGGRAPDPKETLDTVIGGGENEQKQALHDLAVAARQERERVDRGDLAPGKAFFADPAFRERLVAAFEDAFDAKKGPERQAALALTLAAVRDPATAPALSARYVPKTDPQVRQAIVHALGALPTDDVVPALVRALGDPDDAVRNFAVHGLQARRTPAREEAVRGALSDTSPLVRMTAASALALWGDPAVVAQVEQLLDPEWVRVNVVAAPTEHPGFGSEGREQARFRAHYNGIKGAHALARHAPGLKAKVEAFTRDRDPALRALARDVVDRWDEPPLRPADSPR